MKIQQLEQATGLDRATIRFYEKEGLIHPQRLENGYREYTQNDRDTLLKVKLLRQLGIGLESIKKVQQGSEDFSSLLLKQSYILERESHSHSRARDLCQTMLCDGTEYTTLDAASYLARADSRLAAPSKPVTEVYIYDTEPRECHPVKRLLARFLDHYIYKVVLGFVLTVLLRIRPVDIWMTVIGYGILFISVPINAALLHLFGATPGKWIMGFRVERPDGRKLSFSDAWYREWAVLCYGFGWGIPIWDIYRMYKSYRYYKDIGEPEWDEDNEYIYRKSSLKHIAASVAAIAVVIGMVLVVAWDSAKPAFRGENLTVSQFSQNYNYCLTLIDENPSRTDKLQRDGTRYTESQGTIRIYLDAPPVNEHANLSYETEDGYIRKITYHNTWTDIRLRTSSVPNICLNAIYTAILSQKGMDLEDYTEIDQMLADELGKKSAGFSFRNLDIRWEISCVNCTLDSYGYISAEDGTKSSFSLDFEIIIKDST